MDHLCCEKMSLDGKTGDRVGERFTRLLLGYLLYLYPPPRAGQNLGQAAGGHRPASHQCDNASRLGVAKQLKVGAPGAY